MKIAGHNLNVMAAAMLFQQLQLSGELLFHFYTARHPLRVAKKRGFDTAHRNPPFPTSYPKGLPEYDICPHPRPAFLLFRGP